MVTNCHQLKINFMCVQLITLRKTFDKHSDLNTIINRSFTTIFLIPQINEPKSIQNKADLNPAQTRHSKIEYWQGEKPAEYKNPTKQKSPGRPTP